jgi:diguanylate cyclase (GGDEF)-like protein/PAS domain S-box-containing protein
MCEDRADVETGAARMAADATGAGAWPALEAGTGQSEAQRLLDRYAVAERIGCDGVWEWQPATGFVALSPRFLALVGIPAAPGGHRVEDWFLRVHPDDLIWLLACFEGQREKAPAPFIMEHRVRDGDGWRWLACRGIAVPGRDGAPDRLIGAISEIAEIKNAEQRLRQSEERYTLAAAAASDGLYDWDLSTNAIYYSPRWKAILGFTPQEIGDSPDEWLGRVVPEDLIWLQATLDEQRQRSRIPVQSFKIEYRIRDAGQTLRWMLCCGMTVRDDNGDAVRMIGSQADITDRKRAEQQLRQSEERYALAARGANDGLWDWRLDIGETYLSPRCLSMLGFPEAALENRLKDWFRLVASEDRPALVAALRRHLAGSTDHLAHEFRMSRADGTTAWCQIRGSAVRDGEGRPVRIAGSVTDVTARKKAELRLQFNAFHDGLTGLPNRSLLLDRIGQMMARQTGGSGHFAVLLLDIDRFKSINDSLGNAMGDLVLSTTATRLLRLRRTGDTLARLSADEFALLTEEVSEPATALVTAHRMRGAVARPFHLENRDIVLTASVGIALSISGYERAEDMLRDASLAMVRAKGAGRARAEVFDTRLRLQALTQVRTESELRRALDEGQLCLHYQPIVFLDGGAIAGFEALIRWQHPERGLVGPGEFVPLAEESGLIVPIGRWVLEEAAHQLVVWQAGHPERRSLFASVNVSTRQLRDDDLLALVERVLRKTGISPSCLKLEITESMLMHGQDEAEPMMRAIQRLGVHFSIDDFGTGYSSLSYLHRVPANTLKIDKSFVQAIGDGPEKAAIVQLIAALGDMLGMDVVAEGIETEPEARFLRGLRCRYGQGYLYARPLPAEQIEALLRGPPLSGPPPAAGEPPAQGA